MYIISVRVEHVCNLATQKIGIFEPSRQFSVKLHATISMDTNENNRVPATVFYLYLRSMLLSNTRLTCNATQAVPYLSDA